MRNISTKQKDKKNSTSPYRSQFQAQQCGDKLAKKLESLQEKKAVHTLCKHGVRPAIKLT